MGGAGGGGGGGGKGDVATAGGKDPSGIDEALAVAAATTYSASDPTATAKNTALQQRLTATLNVPQGVQSIQNIQAELAGAQSSLKAASDRHQQTSATLSNLQEQINGVSNEEVGSQILALQTRMQASLQVTASLYKISLVNFI